MSASRLWYDHEREQADQDAYPDQDDHDDAGECAPAGPVRTYRIHGVPFRPIASTFTPDQLEWRWSARGTPPNLTWERHPYVKGSDGRFTREN